MNKFLHSTIIADILIIVKLHTTFGIWLSVMQLNIRATEYWARPTILEGANLDEYELYDSLSTKLLFSRYARVTILDLDFVQPVVTIIFLIVAVDGPYQDRAKIIYTDLRNNLIQYETLFQRMQLSYHVDVW